MTGLHTEPRAALVGGQRLPLSPTESKVLQLIINAGDTPISRLQIEREVYGASGRKSNTIEVTVCRLRQKLVQHGYRINVTRSRGYTISQAGEA